MDKTISFSHCIITVVYSSALHFFAVSSSSHPKSAWSLTMRVETRQRIFENRVLWSIFGPMRDEVTGEWRRIHNKELYALYSTQDTIRVVRSRRLRWSGRCSMYGVELHTKF